MPPLLKTFEPELLQLVVAHPAQLRLADRIADLLADLRTCTTPRDYQEFQGTLFHDLYDVEERRRAVSRVVKRLRRGERLPPDPPELEPLPVEDVAQRWQIEDMVLERLARQLRTVGDALAWRALGYDRRYVLAMSQNALPGPMSGKAGLPFELGAVMERWEQKGHFSLLHDITSCLRIGDLTEFAADGTRHLWEIKSKPGRGSPAQLSRMSAAIDTVNTGTPLPGGETLVAVATPLRTRLDALDDAIRLARERGISALRLPPGRAIVAVAMFDAFRLGGDGEEWLARTEQARHAVRRRARIDSATHHFIMRTGDRATRTPAAAPYGIYPIQPVYCAGLICDLIHVEVTFDPQALCEATAARGLDAELLLPPTHGDLDPSDRVMRVRRGDRGIVLHPAFVDQMLAEFVTVDSTAEALDEVLSRPYAPTSPILVFADEASTWR